MATDDFFCARLDQMIDLRHPLAVLARRMPWAQIEAALAPALARKDRSGHLAEGLDLFGPTLQLVGAGVSAAGRPRLPIRLMISLLYLKHAYNESDESVVERWAQDVYFQFFSGQEYFDPRPPCDATQISRFRGAIGEAGVEELLKATIDTAVATKAMGPSEFERVIVDTTVEEKAVAVPTDSRLLEVARCQVVKAAKAAGIELKQKLAREGKQLRRRAGGYAHAKPFKRLRRVLKRQHAVLVIVLREVRRKLVENTGQSPLLARLNTVIERAQRIRTQQPKDKNPPQWPGSGRAHFPRQSLRRTHSVGATRADEHLARGRGCHTQACRRRPGIPGVDDDNPGVQIIHRGRFESLTHRQRRWLRRR